jgi:hypothetical protein
MGADQDFYDNLIVLIDYIIEIIKHIQARDIKIEASTGTLSAAKMYLSTCDSHSIVTGFIKRSYPYWDRVHNKDLDFLVNNSCVLFSEVGKEHIQAFTSIFALRDKKTNELVLDEKIYACIWEIVHEMVKSSILYIHEYRKPDPSTGKYTVEYFPYNKDTNEGIRVSVLVKKWNVTV